MLRLLDPLWLLLASATDRQLFRMVEYLKVENRILRDKLPKRIPITPREKNRLIKFGKPLGDAIKQLIGIVHPKTFLRWIAGSSVHKKTKRTPGRPSTAPDIKCLILKLAGETGWGYTRILGELKKLGIHSVCRSTVVNILKDAGFDPGPDRKAGSWSEFVRRHAETLWASDFLSVKTWTKSGQVELYLLFFVHVGSRRVIVSNPTAHPDATWVTEQARNAAMAMEDLGLRCTDLIIDHDTKYTAAFDRVFEAEGTEVKRVGPRAPDLNAYAERFVQTLKLECLDHFAILGDLHLRHLANEFLAHYHDERPHQGIGNVPLGDNPVSAEEPSVMHPFPAKIDCRERLGGLLKHYSRAA